MNIISRIRRYLGLAHKYATKGETSSNRSARFQSRQVLLLILHATQLVMAIILMGLTAYNVHYVAYEILAACLFVEISTMMVATCLIVCRIRYARIYSHYASTVLQVLIFALSIIALGLLASLAQKWKQPQCTYDFKTGYRCSSNKKRGLRTLHERDFTSYNTYSGALIAGSILISLQIILWAITTGLAVFDIWTDHKTATAMESRIPEIELAIPSVTSAQQRTSLAEAWDSAIQAPTTHRSGPEPLLPDSDDVNENPHLLAPPPLRFVVTNRDHTPLSTPVFEVPPYVRTPTSEPIVHETEANIHVLAAPPVLPHIDIVSTPQRYEAYNPNVPPRRKTIASRLDQ
ncbi:hypothetical protein T440DRAFT_383030 [Plenodomus tracheiphilus IPT5]|uniref:MARVEL domain-containing protein n=1 Tax=Plenodomus tracheiphilus IPT5 TaxID=1408161 RepID=A0A6A7BQH7_9PLEO|nr:hypothetical protein T440DRAFT_383030 [Plenodomus tracheiphilus IPT5]